MSKKLTTEEFIVKARKVHGDEYGYDNVIYEGTDKNVSITCKIHGDFPQTPHMHLAGQGCPDCYSNKKYTTETYIKRAKEVHPNSPYDYTETEYQGIFKPITIRCLNHGYFTLQAHSFLCGSECQECSGKRRYDRDYLIKKAREVHGDKYDYSLVGENIKNNRQSIPIICPVHGVFNMPIDNHINQKQGCKKCSSSKLQKEIRDLLNEYKIEFEEEKSFDWLKTTKWTTQKLDFYLPKHNIGIECQGEQHFIASAFGSKKKSKEEMFKVVQDLDKRKYNLCKKHGIDILYFSHIKPESYPYQLLHEHSDLINMIQNVRKVL